jgi:hypothetical protein
METNEEWLDLFVADAPWPRYVHRIKKQPMKFALQRLSRLVLMLLGALMLGAGIERYIH